jgi:transcriptional regulator with XRE-family HTH domain
MSKTKDWLETLRQECEASSQVKIARRLGVSTAMINQVLKGVYKGNASRLEALVRGELMLENVACPVLGEISKRRCLDEQARPFGATNPQRVALYKACRNGCDYSSIK